VIRIIILLQSGHQAGLHDGLHPKSQCQDSLRRGMQRDIFQQLRDLHQLELRRNQHQRYRQRLRHQWRLLHHNLRPISLRMKIQHTLQRQHLRRYHLLIHHLVHRRYHLPIHHLFHRWNQLHIRRVCLPSLRAADLVPFLRLHLHLRQQAQPDLHPYICLAHLLLSLLNQRRLLVQILPLRQLHRGRLLLLLRSHRNQLLVRERDGQHGHLQ